MSDLKKKTAYLFENVWTIPNLLSFIRIILVPVFAVLFMKKMFVWAFLCLVVSGLSDLFDGKIARRFNQISELGKVLDPIADKLTEATIAVVMFLSFLKAESHTLNLFAWVFLLYILKELIMLIGGAFMIGAGMHPGAAEIYGKVATMTFYLVMITVMMFAPEVGAFNSAFMLPETVMIVLVIISVILTFVAFASYLPAIYAQFKEHYGWGKDKTDKK